MAKTAPATEAEAAEVAPETVTAPATEAGKKWVVKNPFYDTHANDAFREAGFEMPAETSKERIGHLASLGIIEAK